MIFLDFKMRFIALPLLLLLSVYLGDCFDDELQENDASVICMYRILVDLTMVRTSNLLHTNLMQVIYFLNVLSQIQLPFITLDHGGNKHSGLHHNKRSRKYST